MPFYAAVLLRSLKLIPGFFGTAAPTISGQSPAAQFNTNVAAAADRFTIQIADATPPLTLNPTTYTITLTGVTMGPATLSKTISISTTTGGCFVDRH